MIAGAGAMLDMILEFVVNYIRFGGFSVIARAVDDV